MMKQNTIGILHAQCANMNAESVRLIDVVGDWDVCQFSPLALQCRKFIYSSFTHVVIANSNTHTKNNWFLIWSSPSTHVEMGRLRIASSKIIKTSDIQIMNHQTAVPCVNSMIRVVFFPHRQLNISVAAAAGAVSFISFVVFDTQVKLCLTQQLCEIACHQV